MGLPEINIIFQRLAENAKFRSERGIVALIVNDATATSTSYMFNNIEEVKQGTFTTTVYDYIKLAFLGQPNKVLVEVINTANTRTLDSVLKDLEIKKFNYLAMPKATPEDSTKIVTWVKAQREKGKTFKAVVANVTSANNEGIINFTTDGIKVGTKSYATSEYCTRIAGILAGLSLKRSATYYQLKEVTEINVASNPNAEIDSGKLILINDGTKIKIGRGVNSLVNVELPKTKDMKKIKIIEALDLVREDIKTTFEDYYVGQVTNSYDNKILFLTAVTKYFKDLQKDEIMDDKSEAKAEIDTKAHRDYIKKEGINTDSMSEQEIKEFNTGSNVFATGRAKFLDAMEDLNFNLYM